MKFLIVAASLLVLAHGLTDEQKQKVRDHVMQAAVDCKATAPISESDIETIRKHLVPESKDGKCYVACLLKKLNVMGDDGKLNPAGIDANLQKVKEMDVARYELEKKCMDACIAKVTDTGDQCETAAKLYQCFIDEAKAVNLELVEM